MISEINELLTCGVRTDPSPYDAGETPLHKTRIIGCAIASGGQRWIKSHPRQMAWLRGQGKTAEDAVAEFKRWQGARKTAGRTVAGITAEGFRRRP